MWQSNEALLAWEHFGFSVVRIASLGGWRAAGHGNMLLVTMSLPRGDDGFARACAPAVRDAQRKHSRCPSWEESLSLDIGGSRIAFAAMLSQGERFGAAFHCSTAVPLSSLVARMSDY